MFEIVFTDLLLVIAIGKPVITSGFTELLYVGKNFFYSPMISFAS